MGIGARLEYLRGALPAGVRLVAVSKHQPNGAILEAYEAGQRVFGENRVQELARKAPELPADIEWHLIGHLQRNKVREALRHVRMIQSVDSERLLERIDSECAQLGMVMDCLLELRIAREETKWGMTYAEARDAVTAYANGAYAHVRVRGLMGMGSLTDDAEALRAEFTRLRGWYESLGALVGPRGAFDTLSMGMSGDYELAIACGSTMVRVGRWLFSG